ncbi:hypothetical protein FA95DRAFT_1576709 [Auriscalpium vulgare]|uniref:Uncharacterized protein n=1 Tax=Auriscalpium vulgare TaxID=40419 RepID=A0ACB8RAB8_9AGAM|nr:hypothetical protein FA95DRAFT_1576709 [Auriscalpium vulgare]
MQSHIALEIDAPPRGIIVVEIVVSPEQLVSFGSWQPALTAGPENSVWRALTQPSSVSTGDSTWRSATHPITAPTDDVRSAVPSRHPAEPTASEATTSVSAVPSSHPAEPTASDATTGPTPNHRAVIVKLRLPDGTNPGAAVTFQEQLGVLVG